VAGERGWGRVSFAAAWGGWARGCRPPLAGGAVGGWGVGLVGCGCRRLAAPLLVGPMSATATQDRGGEVRKAAAGLGNPGIHHATRIHRRQDRRWPRVGGEAGGSEKPEAAGGGVGALVAGRVAGGGGGVAGRGCPSKRCRGALLHAHRRLLAVGGPPSGLAVQHRRFIIYLLFPSIIFTSFRQPTHSE
jgi:hypothetical protein